MRIRRLGAWALVAGTLCLAGCTGAPEPESSPIPISVSEQEYLDAQWNIHVASRYSGLDRPEVTPIRRVPRAEFPSIQAECIRAAGFDAGVDPDDSYWYSEPGGQGEALALAVYVCVAEYPLAPEFYQPLTTEQIGEHYDYLVGIAIPCLEGLGISVEDPPSRERYIETYFTSDVWIPYGPITETVASIDEWYEIIDRCPEFPKTD